MSEKYARSISLKDAALSIGLFPISQDSYFLPGALIRVVEAGLEISVTSNSGAPSDTFETKSPFEVNLNGRTYTFSSKDGKLEINELTDIISSSRK